MTNPTEILIRRFLLEEGQKWLMLSLSEKDRTKSSNQLIRSQNCRALAQMIADGDHLKPQMSETEQ